MKSSLAKVSLSVFILSIVFSGCMSKTSVACNSSMPSSISQVGCDKPFIIGKTTRSQVEDNIGGTIFQYKKANDVSKVAYVYTEETSMAARAWGGKKPLKINLELWYDKNNVLIKKKYNNDSSYYHPEMMEGFANITKGLPANNGGNGSITTPFGAIQNAFK